MLELLLDLGWKSALIAGLALFANQLLRRRPAGERVALLRAALAALLLLPLLALAVPELELAVLPALDTVPATALTRPDAGTAAVAPPAVDFDWMAALYVAGAAALLLHLGLGLATLWRWTRAGTPTQDPRWIAALCAARLRRPVRLLVSPRVAAPMSWGLSPAWVLISPAIERQSGQAEAVIAHELAHVRRFDWPVLIAARLAVLCFWFNPLVWLLARELSRQTELAADAEAIGQVGRADYAQTLLTMAGGAAHPAACGMAIGHSALGRRICSVLDARAARPASRLVCAAMLAAAPLAAAPLAATQLVHAAAPAREAIAPAPAPAVALALPTIIPSAQAADAPVIQPRTVIRRVSAPRAARAIATEPPAQAQRDATPALQFHPGHATPAPPTPPAPGTEAAAWREALAAGARPPAPPRVRAAAARRGLTAERASAIEQVGLEKAMAEAAKGLRLRAQELEAVAADGAVPKRIRDAHARSAGSLRNQADRLEKDARRLVTS